MVQVMHFCLFGAKPLSELMLRLLTGPLGTTFREIVIKNESFELKPSLKWDVYTKYLHFYSGLHELRDSDVKS